MIYALHGFLGKPADWHRVLPGLNYEPVDITGFSENDFWKWAKAFNSSVSEKNILLGYSLGGRLALHALLQNPSQWSAAIIVSAHPGLTCENEKRARIAHDIKWAKRFKRDPWDLLMKDWNGQNVFAKDKNAISRKESDTKREVLSDLLTAFSLGKQDCFVEDIAKLDMPILWVAGDQDRKYCLVANKMRLKHPLSQVWIAKGCSHRVPWQASKEFFLQVKRFTHLCREAGCLE